MDDSFRGPEDDGLSDVFLEGQTAISIKMPEFNCCSR